MIINSLRKENNQGKNYRKITTGDWVHEWFNNYAINPSDSKYVKGKLSKNTYTSERYRLKSVFDNEEFCNILIDEVSQSDIYQFVNSLKAKRKRRTNNVIKLRTIKQLEKGYYPEEYYEDDAP